MKPLSRLMLFVPLFILWIGFAEFSMKYVNAQVLSAHAEVSDERHAAGVTSSKSTSSHISEFVFPTPRTGPSIINVDPSGAVWVALARAGKIGHLRAGEMREYSLPPNSFPVGLVLDGSGQVWYSDIRRNKIAKLNPTTGEIKDFDIPTKDSWPFSLAFDANGRLWFTERVGNKIGSLDTASGEIKEFLVPSLNCQPAGLAVTPDGRIFFTENSGHKIGSLNPKTGNLIEHRVPTAMKDSLYYGLAGITSDRHGNIWFAILDGRLGYIRRNGDSYDEIKEIALPTSTTRPAGVALDQWGIVWFTELDGNSISSYSPTLHEFRRYPIPTGAPDPRPKGPPEVTARGELPAPGNIAKTSRPFGIAVDSEGTVWFSEQYAHKVGRLSPEPVEIFQPQGLISGTTAALKIQARSTDNAILHYFVDGKQIPVDDKLDTRFLTPGSHRFNAALISNGQLLSSATSTFSLNPTLANVRQLFNTTARSQRELDVQTALKLKQLLESAERHTSEGETTEARKDLRAMITELDSLSLSPLNVSGLLLESLRYMDRRGRSQHYIEVGNYPPYFSPAKMTIEVGDTVTWIAKGPLRAEHSMLAARNGEFTSPPLPNGQTWSHTFVREGSYEYLNAAAANQVGTVNVKTRTTQILEFPMLGPDRVPGVLAVDAHNNVWFTAGGGGFSRLAAIPLNNRIGRLSADGKITEFETPTIESGPTSIHIGKEGDVWFTERGGNKIGRLNPQTGGIKEYEIPTPMSVATGITVDAEGLVWYASKMASKIGRLDPNTGAIKEYDTPTPKSQPSTITYDAEGNIWFDERANDKIVRLNPMTGQMREYDVPTQGSRVVGLVPDNRRHVWFLELGANKVGRLDTETGMVLEHSIPTKYSSPFKLTIDSYGRVWFTQAFGNKVGVLIDGKFVELAIPTPDSMPGGITTDSRGNIWFTEQAGNKIAMIPSGAKFPPEIFAGTFSSR
jgi:virginiamycin B lyase